MSKLKESTILSTQIYKGKLLDARKDDVLLPNGKKSTREWIKHPGGVCIIPILPNNKIALIRQYRYAVKKELIELPAGKIDANENPKETALRELEEEIGYTSNKLTYITEMYPAVGFASEIMTYFLAEDLIQAKPNLDNDEFVELFPITISKAIKMIWNGKIKDGKTIIGLLWLKKHIKNYFDN